jgi:hypothetical protein
LNIKTRLLAGVSALAVAGGIVAFAAPSANAAVVSVGGCSGTIASGGAKSSTIDPNTGKGYGITDADNRDVTVSIKGLDPTVNKGTNLGTCLFSGGLSTPDSGKPIVKGFSGARTIIKWGGKLYSPELDCNTKDGEDGPQTNDLTEWPANGAFKMTFGGALNNAGKNQSNAIQLVIDGFDDPDNDPNTPSDVVEGHGLVTKGVAAGADVSFQSFFDPIFKDKTQVTATPYFGYNWDINAAIGCTDDNDNGITPGSENNASIITILAGDNGTSLLGQSASGFQFSIGTP